MKPVLPSSQTGGHTRLRGGFTKKPFDPVGSGSVISIDVIYDAIIGYPMAVTQRNSDMIAAVTHDP